MKYIQISYTDVMNELTDKLTNRCILDKLNCITDNTQEINHLYTWKYGDYDILCYGYIEGSLDRVHKHCLPPGAEIVVPGIDESDTQLLFNDIFICMKRNNKFCNIDVPEYALFHSYCFECFECFETNKLDSNELDTYELDSNKLDTSPPVSSGPDMTSSTDELDTNTDLDEDLNEY